ncbi:hypothetical protein Ahia01_000355400 [Argonauta hians]
MDSAFDLRLIQTFSGDKDDLTISEWLENVEMVCRLTDVTKLECVLALRLKGRALKVYHQLSTEDKKDANKIKKALEKVFGTDPFVAYNQFVRRTLQPGEAPEEFGWTRTFQRMDDLRIYIGTTAAGTGTSSGILSNGYPTPG